MTQQAAITFLLRVFGAALTYGFVIAIARVMSVADFGVLGTIMSASLVLSIVASFGQQMALVRFVSPLLNLEKRSAAHAIIASGARLIVAGNGLLMCLLVGGAVVAGMMGRIEHPWAVAVGLLIVPLTGLVDFLNFLARSYNLIVMAVTPKDIVWRLAAMAVIGILVLATGQHTLSLMTVSTILVVVLAAVILGHYLILTRKFGVPGLRDLTLGRHEEEWQAKWKAARFPLWIVSISAVAFINVDVVATALLLGPKAAALYYAANRIAVAPGFFQQSFNIVIGPRLSVRFVSGDRAGTGQMARSAGLQVFFPTLAAAVFLGAIAPIVLGLFGHHFVAATPTLYILLAAAVCNTAFGPSDMVLNMCGEERRSMKISMHTLIGGVLLILGLGFLRAEVGIALGVLLTILWRQLAYWQASYEVLGMRLDVISALVDYFRKGSDGHVRAN